MTTKHICDRCEKEIRGYSLAYNKIKFNHFEHGKKDIHYGPKTYDEDLCDDCMNELIKFLKETK